MKKRWRKSYFSEQDYQDLKEIGEIAKANKAGQRKIITNQELTRMRELGLDTSNCRTIDQIMERTRLTYISKVMSTVMNDIFIRHLETNQRMA